MDHYNCCDHLQQLSWSYDYQACQDIDAQNLHLGIRSCGWDIDYRKLRVYLKNKYNVVQVYIFIGHVSGNEKLYTFLQKCGFILIFKPTLQVKKGRIIIVKGNVDAELVLKCMTQY